MPTPDNFTPLIYLGVITLGFGVFLALAGFDIIKVEKVSVRPGRSTWILGLIMILVGSAFLFSGGAFTNRSAPPAVTPPTAAPDTPAPTPTVLVPEPTATLPPPTEPVAADPHHLLAEAQNWHKVMEDGFDTNANNWDLASVDDGYTVQTLEISESLLKWGIELKNPDILQLKIAPISVPSDFYYSARFRRLAGEGNPGAWWGLFFRRQGSLGYAFIINDSQEYWAGRMGDENGASKWFPLIRQMYTPLLKVNEWNNLAVIVQGAHMRFFINDEPVGEIEDNNLTDGNVGFYVGLKNPQIRVDFEFDDFELRAAP